MDRVREWLARALQWSVINQYLVASWICFAIGAALVAVMLAINLG